MTKDDFIKKLDCCKNRDEVRDLFKNAGDELPDEILACMTGGKTREEIEAVLDNFFGKNSKDIKEKLGMAEPFATFDGISC